MSWRDYIVTSKPHRTGLDTPVKRSFEDIEDCGLKYTKKSSFFIENDSQYSIPLKPSSISSKLANPVADVPVETDGPTPPLQPGWFVAYRNQGGTLCGGCDERDAGTVQECQWDGRAWMAVLTNGDTLALSRIVSVGKTDAEGRVVAAWTVRQHGYDGEGPVQVPF